MVLVVVSIFCYTSLVFKLSSFIFVLIFLGKLFRLPSVLCMHDYITHCNT